MRQWSLTVKRPPRLRLGCVHRLRVTNVQPSDDPSGILVMLENLDPAQQGRVHTCLLPVPIYPEGLTAAFLCACGISVTAGTKITPRKTIGTILGARFRRAENGTYVIYEFEPLDVPEKDARSGQISTSQKRPSKKEG